MISAPPAGFGEMEWQASHSRSRSSENETPPPRTVREIKDGVRRETNERVFWWIGRISTHRRQTCFMCLHLQSRYYLDEISLYDLRHSLFGCWVGFWTFFAGWIEDHRHICPEEVVACPCRMYGCEEKMKRR